MGVTEDESWDLLRLGAGDCLSCILVCQTLTSFTRANNLQLRFSLRQFIQATSLCDRTQQLLFRMSTVALLSSMKVPDYLFTFCLARESGRRPRRCSRLLMLGSTRNRV